MPNILVLKLSELFLYLVPVALLYVPKGMFFPFISGKMLIIRSAIEVAFFLYVILCVKYPQARPRKSFMTLAISLFALSLILSTVFSTSPTFSFFGNAERMEGTFSWLHWIAFFFIMLGISRLDKNFLFKFLVCLLAVSTLISLFALFQYADFQNLLPFVLKSGAATRQISSFLGNSSYLGSFGVFVVFMSLFCYMYFRRFKWFFSAAALFGFVNIFISGTRSALVGFAAGIVAFLAYIAWKDKGVQRRTAIILLALGLVLMTVLWFLRTQPWFEKIPTLGEFSRVLSGYDSSNTRLLVWQAFLRSFTERPVFGWGIEQMIPAFTEHINPRLFSLENAWFDRAHNKFIDVLTMQGIFGFIAFLLILSAAIKNIVRAKVLAAGRGGYSLVEPGLLLAFLFAYLGNHMFIFDFNASFIIFFVFLVLTERVGEAASPNTPPVRKELGLFSYFALLAVGVVALFSLLFNYRSYQSNALIVRASQQRDPAIAVSLFQKALDISRAFQEETVQQFASYLRGLPQSETRSSAAPVVRDYMKEIIMRNPLNLKNRIFEIEALTSMYLVQSQSDKPDPAALESLRAEIEQKISMATDLAPNMPNPYFIYANTYFTFGDYQAALENLKKVLELSPDSGLAHILAGYMFLRTGDTGAALKYANLSIEKGFGFRGNLKAPEEFGQAISYIHQIYEAAGETKELPEVDARIFDALERGALQSIGRGGKPFTPEQRQSIGEYLVQIYSIVGLQDQIKDINGVLQRLEERYIRKEF